MRTHPLFTVFTPTYNRASVINRVYESLLLQTFKDFEWLIVDDGSTDETRGLVEHWTQDSQTWFPIRYVYQENQHKKVAHNRGVREARGELFLTLDSDDTCVPEALDRLAHHWYAIPEGQRDRFSAVTSLCRYEDGSIVGDSFPCDGWIDSDSLEMTYRYRTRGEKWGFQRRDVLRNYLFPEMAVSVPGYVPEGLVWSAVARNYKTRFVNEALRIYHQDKTGEGTQITSKRNIAVNAPGSLLARRSMLERDIDYLWFDPVTFLKNAALLTRSYLHCPDEYRSNYWPRSFVGKILVAAMAPVGFWFYLMDTRR